MLKAAQLIVESCRSLIAQLEDLAAANGLLVDQDTNTSTSTSSQSNTLADPTPSPSAPPAAIEGVDASTSSSQGSASSSGSAGTASKGSSKGAAFVELLKQYVQQGGVIDWLVPPMLQGSNTDLGGWV